MKTDPVNGSNELIGRVRIDFFDTHSVNDNH